VEEEIKVKADESLVEILDDDDEDTTQEQS
jgi:hypothetical protein